MSAIASPLTPPISHQASRAGSLYVSQRMSADMAMGLIAAMKDGHARVEGDTPRRSTTSSSASSSSSSSVAIAPQTPSSPSAVPRCAETAPPPTYRAPAYTLIDLTVAKDPVLRAKIDALPAVSHPLLAGKAQAAKAVEQSASMACSQEELTYEEVMKLVGPVVRKEKGEEAENKGKGRRLVAWMRGRL
ncbi:hypothetical protein MMC17_002115 [Xylographa soralifera]|nr:hypothetical protein [Xylographa soralifera]